MPFKSEQQRRFLWAKHPEIAQRWTDEYGSTPVTRRIKRMKKRSKIGDLGASKAK